jgi:hypothetical protein
MRLGRVSPTKLAIGTGSEREEGGDTEDTKLTEFEVRADVDFSRHKGKQIHLGRKL